MEMGMDWRRPFLCCRDVLLLHSVSPFQLDSRHIRAAVRGSRLVLGQLADPLNTGSAALIRTGRARVISLTHAGEVQMPCDLYHTST
jgi:hypothetical protein